MCHRHFRIGFHCDCNEWTANNTGKSDLQQILHIYFMYRHAKNKSLSRKDLCMYYLCMYMFVCISVNIYFYILLYLKPTIFFTVI